MKGLLKRLLKALPTTLGAQQTWSKTNVLVLSLSMQKIKQMDREFLVAKILMAFSP